jgi:phospholipid/cholesterol/gamma-HCH transport system substrate-binding protein
MRVSRFAPLVLAVVALGITLVVLSSGDDDGYRIKLPLASATGLEDGSSVQIGGIDRGRVDLHLAKDDQVVAEVTLDDGAGPVGSDARASIEAQNFLGRKKVVLLPGHPSRGAAPSGWTMPADRIGTPTDLDQVLGVFDANTRTRAKIVLNELGAAVVGRRVDISTLLKEFPVGLEHSSAVLQALKTDDATMDDLLTRSDRIVAAIAPEHRALGRLVETVGTTAHNVAARRAELRQTLAEAPGTLRTLHGFLDDLEATTHDLGPAARQLTAAAPSVQGALAEVDDFRKAADPALDEARDAAPKLTELADGATPVARRALPTARSLAAMATELTPVSHTLDNSADNVIAILENWSRAIQFRDGLSHVFRGEASYSPDLILSAVNRLTAGQRAKERKRKANAATPKRTAPPAAKPAPSAPQTNNPVKKVLDVLDRVTGQVPKAVDDVQKTVTGLLDYLLKP